MTGIARRAVVITPVALAFLSFLAMDRLLAANGWEHHAEPARSLLWIATVFVGIAVVCGLGRSGAPRA